MVPPPTAGSDGKRSRVMISVHIEEAGFAPWSLMPKGEDRGTDGSGKPSPLTCSVVLWRRHCRPGLAWCPSMFFYFGCIEIICHPPAMARCTVRLVC